MNLHGISIPFDIPRHPSWSVFHGVKGLAYCVVRYMYRILSTRFWNHPTQYQPFKTMENTNITIPTVASCHHEPLNEYVSTFMGNMGCVYF